MLLSKVVLRDYGVYRGRNEFDFACTGDRPVILIGGENGAGKTTLFESIMLCLYGADSVGKRVSKKAYCDLLARRIHRYAGSPTPADSASVMVQFRFFYDGREEEYQVDRSWRSEDGRIAERLDVRRSMGGEGFRPLDLMEQSHWQSFIREMLPRGIARLFFFDGERVSEIAETGSEDLAIRASFSSLLGLSLVEQLQSDLQTNLMRNLAPNDAALQGEMAKYEAQQAETAGLIERLREKEARKEAEIHHTRSEIEELEDKISGIGGGFAARRAELRAVLDSDVAARDSLERRIRDMCGSVLPFSIIPGRMRELEEQVLRDQELQRVRAGEEIARSILDAVRRRVGSESFWEGLGIPPGAGKRARDGLMPMLSAGPGSDSGDGVFDYSAAQAGRILDVAGRAGGPIMSELEESTSRLVEAGERIARAQAALSSAPDDDEIGPVFSRLKERIKSLGGLQAELEHLRTEIASNESLLRHTKVKMRGVVSQRYKNSKLRARAELTERVQAVLEEYASSLRTRKLALLEQYVADAAGTLMHKRDFIGRVAIDRDTFAVTLFGRDGEQIPREMLSTGEKQMLATAILWALARTSGRSLPFVIDTPLARLDEAHRDNMVEKFFPLASHQVLVFSTNTEIGPEYYKKLEPYTARSYTVEFAQESGSTRLRPGYFWDRKGRKRVEAR